MAISNDEIVDLIINLFARHVPDSLDKRLVLERLSKNRWILPEAKCSLCRGLLVCPECDHIDIDTDVDVTVRIGGRIISP
jgi:hypothetical protein